MTMDINKFTEKLQEALSAAQSKAVRYGHQQVDIEHLLMALMEQERGLATAILNKANVDVESLRRRLEQELEKIPKVSSSTGATDNVYISGRLNKLLTQAEDESKKLGDAFISVEHVLLAITDDSGVAGRILRESGITRERLMQVLREVRGSQRVTSQNPEATYEALEKYGRDLTTLAGQ